MKKSDDMGRYVYTHFFLKKYLNLRRKDHLTKKLLVLSPEKLQFLKFAFCSRFITEQV